MTAPTEALARLEATANRLDEESVKHGTVSFVGRDAYEVARSIRTILAELAEARKVIEELVASHHGYLVSTPRQLNAFSRARAWVRP